MAMPTVGLQWRLSTSGFRDSDVFQRIDRPKGLTMAEREHRLTNYNRTQKKEQNL